MRNLTVSFGEHPARLERAESLTWEEYAAALTVRPPESEDKASRGWSLPATFAGGWRDAEHLVSRDALTFDFDAITRADVKRIQDALKPHEHVVYTTASHTDEKPRLRAVLPLSRPATPDEFSAVSRKIAESVGIELASRESHVPAQMMYLPTVRPGGRFKARRQRGAWVDVDAVLASYADWTDRGQWPRRKEHDSTRRADIALDPRQKHGVVGEFCRAFTIPEAIAAYELPYQHVHGNRWTYTRGSRPEGAVVYDEDTKLHSHHDTDPARGQHNAFDLVRLHKYGALDAGYPETADPTTLPSYKEFTADLATDAGFLDRRAAAVLDDLPALPPLTPEQEAAGLALRESNPAAVAAERRLEEGKQKAEATKGVLTRPLADVLAHPTITSWLIRDTIEESVIAVIAGPRGSYKSFIALHWAMTVAQFADVYVVSAEGGDFDRRAAAWIKAHGGDRPTSQYRLYVVERRLDLNSVDGIKLIRAECERLKIKPALFVLDTFSKLSGGLEENDNTAVKTFIGRLDNGLKRFYGASVLLVAHTGHAEKGRPRGASAFGADTDAEYIVSRTERSNFVTVTRERFKSSPELPPLTYAAEVIPLEHRDADGERATSLIMRETSGTRGPNGLPFKPSGAVQKIAWQECREFLAIGPGNVEELIGRIAGKLLAPPEGQRDRRETAVRRVLEQFMAAGVLFIHDEDTVSLNRARMEEP